MLTNTDINNLFNFYLENYCPEELVILSELRCELLVEMEKASTLLKNTVFKDFSNDSLYKQQSLDVVELIKKRLNDTFLINDYRGYYCDGPIRDLFNIIIKSDLVRVIDADTMEVMGKKDSLPELKNIWFRYLSFSSNLMTGMINFLICLESNKNIFTEGKVKEIINKYGSNRRYKI
jgi:hypothetical protein